MQKQLDGRRALALVASALAAGLAIAASAKAPDPSPIVGVYGAAPTLEDVTPLATVMQTPERFGAEPILLHGRLTDVCQKKGCWTILQDGGEHIRVRFLDYGFFVPKDSIGAEAYVQGTVKIEVLSEKDARHYEEEARDGDPDSIKGPQREVGFLASGVRIVTQPSSGTR